MLALGFLDIRVGLVCFCSVLVVGRTEHSKVGVRDDGVLPEPAVWVCWVVFWVSITYSSEVDARSSGHKVGVSVRNRRARQYVRASGLGLTKSAG